MYVCMVNLSQSLIYLCCHFPVHVQKDGEGTYIEIVKETDATEPKVQDFLLPVMRAPSSRPPRNPRRDYGGTSVLLKRRHATPITCMHAHIHATDRQAHVMIELVQVHVSAGTDRLCVCV